MNKETLFKAIGFLRSDNQKRINDSYIWSSIALVALKKTVKDDLVLNQNNFPVPSSVSNKIIERTPEKIRAILNEASRRDFYSAILVNLVSLVEGGLSDLALES